MPIDAERLVRDTSSATPPDLLGGDHACRACSDRERLAGDSRHYHFQADASATQMGGLVLLRRTIRESVRRSASDRCHGLEPPARYHLAGEKCVDQMLRLNESQVCTTGGSARGLSRMKRSTSEGSIPLTCGGSGVG